MKYEKQLKQEGRGFCDSKVEMNSNLVAVLWYGNKSVDLLSSYTGIQPQTEVSRSDRKEKEESGGQMPGNSKSIQQIHAWCRSP